jgi:hypothetical protein
MSLAPTLYRSTDVGAPTLNGTLGSMAALLDAVLVNGYGTGPSAKAGAGWTVAFTASNKRVYRNNPITGSGRYLRVDDTGSINNARTAAVQGFATMSDIDTGTYTIPATGVAPNGSLWLKSGLLNADANDWIVIATQNWFYLFVCVTGSGSSEEYRNVPFFAGDIDSRIPADSMNFYVSWTRLTSYTSNTYFPSNALELWMHHGYAMTNNYEYAAGAILQASGGGVSGWCKNCLPSISRQNMADYQAPGSISSGFDYPDAVAGALILERIHVSDGVWELRGFLPNVYSPFHYRPFSNGTLVTDVEGFPGVTFLALTIPCAGSPLKWGVALFDVTTEAIA